MSVAAMTMDDQRPLMNSFEKMSKQYEQSLHVSGHNNNTGTNSSAAPPSGPASPTPSGSEEPPPQNQFHHSHHHHHHNLHHHPHQQYHQHHNHHQTTIEEQQQQHQSEHQHLNNQQQQQVEQQILQESSVVAEAVAAAEQRQRLLEDEIEGLKLEQTRLAQQCADAQRREKILMRRLANKEQEFQDYVAQIAEFKAAQAPTAVTLRTALLDPAVNLLFEKLKKELKATKAKLEETQNELAAWKFTPDSNTGKRLMAKCRLLYQENEELGKMTSNGRLAKLETELAMQKSFSEEVKKSQSELDDFLQELDEDVEGMQSTIIFLQQELKTTRERIQVLEKENYQLKSGLKEHELLENAGSTNLITNGDDSLVVADVKATPYHIPAALNNTPSANEYKYHPYMKQPILETINENECLQSPQHTDYYNGIVEESHQRMVSVVPNIPNMVTNAQQIPNSRTAMLIGNEECSSNSSNTSNNQYRPTTVAARKRNYDESSEASPDYSMSAAPNAAHTATTIPAAAQPFTNSMPTAMQQQQVSSPRTLPPKKSKLRITTSRSSEQLNELPNDMVMHTTNPSPYIPPSPLHVMDPSVPCIQATNEDYTKDNSSIVGNNMMGENDNIDGNVPQRIMTRRRSARMQQNGNGNGNGNGCTGDNSSNH